MNPFPAIQIENLRKKFGKKEVLRGVNLEVPAGSIFGFLGLNGMGKTTLIRTLLGLSKPDEGKCLVDGIDSQVDPIEIRRRVGYMAENQTMYGWMRVQQIIDWVSHFHMKWDSEYAAQMLKQMRLDPKARVGALSKGQTSHLALLLALAHRPRIVVLDDPTLGLDPIGRRDLIRDVIAYLQSEGVTVFFSSHLLYEIEPICDEVAILHEGRIIKCSPVDELRERVKRIAFKMDPYGKYQLIPGVLDVQKQNDKCLVTVSDIEKAKASFGELHLTPLLVQDLNLDEIFEAHVIGRKEKSHN